MVRAGYSLFPIPYSLQAPDEAPGNAPKPRPTPHATVARGTSAPYRVSRMGRGPARLGRGWHWPCSAALLTRFPPDLRIIEEP
jgi:hypothetical protein